MGINSKGDQFARPSAGLHVAFMSHGAADTEWSSLKTHVNFLQHDATWKHLLGDVFLKQLVDVID